MYHDEEMHKRERARVERRHLYGMRILGGADTENKELLTSIALICGTIAYVSYICLTRADGALLALFMGFVGALIGIPIGQKLENVTLERARASCARLEKKKREDNYEDDGYY